MENMRKYKLVTKELGKQIVTNELIIEHVQKIKVVDERKINKFTIIGENSVESIEPPSNFYETKLIEFELDGGEIKPIYVFTDKWDYELCVFTPSEEWDLVKTFNFPTEKKEKIETLNKSITLEFKNNNRFVVEFPEQFNINSWAVQRTDKPKFTNGKWENIKIEFIDPISPSTSQSLFKIVQFLTNNEISDKSFKVRLKALDPTGASVEEWVVNVSKILTIDFDEYDYNNDNLQKPFLIIEPINCVLKPQQF